MTDQAQRAADFARLHVKGDPLILFNVWDAGSARAVQEAGAKAIATGSFAVATAHGYTDGEKLPYDLVLANLRRIVAQVDLPVTLDFEGGYGRTPDVLWQNTADVIAAGAVGINFEDQSVGGEGLYSVEEQTARIAAIRNSAEQTGVPLFINARTDVFLKVTPALHDASHLDEAIERAAAYAEAGASGFFAPGVRKAAFIERLCAASPLPVNILFYPDTPTPKEMAALGVARISYGAYPYRQMLASLKTAAAAALAME